MYPPIKYTKEVAKEASALRKLIVEQYPDSDPQQALLRSELLAAIPAGRARLVDRHLVASGVPISLSNMRYNVRPLTPVQDLIPRLERLGYTMMRHNQFLAPSNYILATPNTWLPRHSELVKLERMDARRRSAATRSLLIGIDVLSQAESEEEKASLMDILVATHALNKPKLLALMSAGDASIRSGLIESLGMTRPIILSPTSWQVDIEREGTALSMSLLNTWAYAGKPNPIEQLACDHLGSRPFKKLLGTAATVLLETGALSIDAALRHLHVNISSVPAPISVDPLKAGSVIKKFMRSNPTWPLWPEIDRAVKNSAISTQGRADGLNIVLNNAYRSLVLKAALVLAIESGHWGSEFRPSRYSVRLTDALASLASPQLAPASIALTPIRSL